MKSRESLKSSKTTFDLTQLENEALVMLDGMTLNEKKPENSDTQQTENLNPKTQTYNTAPAPSLSQHSRLFDTLEQRFQAHAEAPTRKLTLNNQPQSKRTREIERGENQKSQFTL